MTPRNRKRRIQNLQYELFTPEEEETVPVTPEEEEAVPVTPEEEEAVPVAPEEKTES